MKYGLNGAGFPADDFEENCRVAAAAGYDGVEPAYERDGLLSTPAGREKARSAVEEYGLAVPAISTTAHWDYPLSSHSTAERERGIAIGKRMVDAAAALGAEYVLIVPAVVEPGTNYDDAYGRAVEAVRSLAAYAADAGVEIAVENVQNGFLYSPRELVDFLDDVADAAPASVYFDVGNGLRWGLPDRWIRELGDHVSRVHVKDWRTEDHRVTYPLQGDVDWPSVRSALDEVDYSGWLTAEVPPYESHPERTPSDVLDAMQFLFGDD